MWWAVSNLVCFIFFFDSPPEDCSGKACFESMDSKEFGTQIVHIKLYVYYHHCRQGASSVLEMFAE